MIHIASSRTIKIKDIKGPYPEIVCDTNKLACLCSEPNQASGKWPQFPLRAGHYHSSLHRVCDK